MKTADWARAKDIQRGDMLASPPPVFRVRNVTREGDEIVVVGGPGVVRRFGPNDKVNVLRGKAAAQAPNLALGTILSIAIGEGFAQKHYVVARAANGWHIVNEFRERGKEVNGLLGETIDLSRPDITGTQEIHAGVVPGGQLSNAIQVACLPEGAVLRSFTETRTKEYVKRGGQWVSDAGTVESYHFSFDSGWKNQWVAPSMKNAALDPDRLRRAIRRGEVNASGAHFSLPGSSTYHDEMAVELGEASYYDLSAANLADTDDAQVTIAILQEAMKAPGLSDGEHARLEGLLVEAEQNEPVIGYQDNEELQLAQAAQRLGYDGLLEWENDDYSGPSTVFLLNTAKAKKASVKRAMRINVPESEHEHFFEEPPEGHEEFWALRFPPKGKPGDAIVFHMDKQPVAEAVISRIEKPGEHVCEATGRFENRWKIYWSPESFKKTAAMRYPLADRNEWYGNCNYADDGGRLIEMSPDDFLAKVRPLDIDDTSRDNIDDLKQHMQSGRTLDPLTIYADGKEDGRHRAHAAKELGIKSVPVLVFGDPSTKQATAKVAFGAPNDAQTKALEDMLPRVQAGYNFEEWLAELIGDDTNPSFEGVKQDRPLFLEYLAEWLQEDHSISVEENGCCTFWKLDEETRELIGDLPVIVYHHTSSAILPKIKREGLRADVKRINTHQNSGAGVYVTTELSGPAVNGYHYHAVQKHKRNGNRITLAIKTYIADLSPDPDDANITSGAHQFILPYVSPTDIIWDDTV